MRINKIAEDVTSNIIAGIIIALCFLIFSDLIFKEPNISGRWIFKLTYQDTQHLEFKDMEVYFLVNLLQNENNVSGFGEKIYEKSNLGEITYSGKDKIPIKISGKIENNFIKKDNLILTYHEEGHIRNSSTYQNLIINNNNHFSGFFDSTIADSKGSSEWWKNKNIIELIK